MRAHHAIGAIALTCIAVPVQASWLSKITGVHVNLNGGPVLRIEAPQPQAIPEMLQNLPKDAAQFVLSPHGTALAAAIRHARGQTRPSAQPIPANIRQALQPYFPEVILNKARWAKRNDVKWALDTAVMKISEPSGITLDDVIVFNDDIDPTSDDFATLELWAHELTHVLQYENMGVESFAFIYGYDPGRLEGQASSNASQVRNRLASDSNGAGYYSVSASIGQEQLAQQQFIQTAKQIVPASDCVRWQTNMPGAMVQNICGIPIGITGWRQINPWTGMPFEIPCVSNCGIGAGMVKQFASPQPGLWVDIGFTY